jgi:signal transduction histidine kinase
LSLANYSRASLRWEEVDLAMLARNTIAALRERSPQRRAQVDIEPALPVHGDPRLLAQVMSNLLGNAWKFTAGVAAVRIAVGCERDASGTPVYYVRDNGVGFDMAHAARMFEAFQRMHSTAEFDGTGIGLAIVHKIVTRHNGRIWADAAPGQGATFRFTLGDTPA